MTHTSRTIVFFLLFSSSFFSFTSFSIPKGKQTGVTFDQALPEDISNDNFPDKIESFDFPNANLLDLVKAIGKLTGINFIVDPGLQGKRVSIIAPSPITVAEAYKAFLSTLAANGYTIVKSGAFWKIQTTSKSLKDNIEVYSGDYFPNTDHLITRIIKLKYINAKDFTTSIKYLLSDGNQISSHNDSNSIILSDYGSVIERIMKIVNEIDVPGSEEGIVIIPIEHASAEELSVILGQLLFKSSAARSSRSFRLGRKPRISLSPNVKKASALGGNLKISSIIPDIRTNSLVVSANTEGEKRVRELIQKLDTPIDPSRTGGVYVYNVLYGTAEEVYNTLMGIKPSSSVGEKRSRPFQSYPPSLSRRSRYGQSSSQSPLFDENVTIMADSNTNSLIISAKNKYDYKRVESVLKKIDVPRDQVFIQAIIVEMIVSQGNEKEINLAGAVGGLLKEALGDNYQFSEIFGSSIAGFLNRSLDVGSLQNAKFGPGLVLGLPLLKLLEGVVSPFQNGQNVGEAGNSSDVAGSSALQATLGSSVNPLATSFFPLLRLFRTASNINVLSTPQLTTLDNTPAFIEVGENAPVGLTSTATVGSVAQNSVDRKDITLRLDIVPRINPESGTVQMDIKQKFDDFSNRSSTASELATRGVHIVKRNIETKMVLNDGETAVLGGLLTDKETKTEDKVPFLGDIPVLGWLFKGSKIEKEKRNLLVFITPTIIKGKKQKEKTKEILGKKLSERIHFIKKHMKGRDPHGHTLKKLIPKAIKGLDDKKNKIKWFWEKRNSPSDQKNKPKDLGGEEFMNQEIDLFERENF